METKSAATAVLPIRPLLFLGVIGTEAALLLVYLSTTGTTVQSPRYLLYPFVWINVALWAFLTVVPVVGNRRHRYLALPVAVGYYLLLMEIAGNVVFVTHSDLSVSLESATPGWGPVLIGTVPGLEFRLIPFETIGYAGLAYLFYANVLSVSRGLLAGTLGLLTCVSCSLPLWGPLFGLIGGPATGLIEPATRLSYDIGTVIFLLTVFVLYYSNRGRPSSTSFPDGSG
ncbi:MAG: DUF7546 family protein [Halodesulfurarchaeum sp.]